MRVDLWDHEGGNAFAQYKNFRLGNEGTGFKLHVGKFKGNAGNVMVAAPGHCITTSCHCLIETKPRKGSYNMTWVAEVMGSTWICSLFPKSSTKPLIRLNI